MTRKFEVRWLDRPEEHNYPAAGSYLSLLYPDQTAQALVAKMRRAKMVQFMSKDIFRASGLVRLGDGNSHVSKDRKRIEAGQKLSPLLLVRDAAHGKVLIADGYHRLCAVYSFDEDAIIPCKIV